MTSEMRRNTRKLNDHTQLEQKKSQEVFVFRQNVGISLIVSYLTINNVRTHKFPLRKLNSRLTVLQFIVK